MSKSTMDLSGPLLGNLRKLAAQVPDAAARGLYYAAEHVLGESNDIVPHEEGDFERGGVASVDAEALVSAISYKDTAFPGQAEWLHEAMNVHHDDGRQAKFLETAMNKSRKEAAQIIATQIKGAL